jgi:hypothetical protein
MPASPKRGKVHAALKKIALGLPETEEGIACKGTAIESAVYKSRKKSFLFIGADLARLKLDASIAEAKKLAKAKPGSCEVGSQGWVAVPLGPEAPPLDVLQRWVGESYEVVSGPKAAAKKKR